MTLLCTSLLALLLLPLSLSCDRALKKVRDDFRAIVETDLINARDSVITLLQNSSCPELKHRPPNCTEEKPNIVNTLLIQACKMQSSGLNHTKKLANDVQQSIACPCPEKLTEEANVRSKKRGTATRKMRKEHKKSRKETKKLCKAKAIMSSMTECYEILNTLLMDA